MHTDCWIGIDLGTSGCRAIAIDVKGRTLGRHSSPFPPALSATEQNPDQLWTHVKNCLASLIAGLDSPRVQAISIDATSGSIMLTDMNGQALTLLILYNDTRARQQADTLRHLLPEDSPAQGVSGGLAKLLWLKQSITLPDHYQLMHQADWINHKLGVSAAVTDSHNALKTGFDPVSEHWPDWLKPLAISDCLPTVISPGRVIGRMSPVLSRSLGLADSPIIRAGTTDSTAAFIATGARHSGQAVTVLGSTLVLKLLSNQPVFNNKHGIYSHRLGNLWLTGGASNTGGRVLKHFFSDADIERLSKQIDIHAATADYYPLLSPGERFPIADPDLEPRLSPRPDDDILFLHGLLASMARIEQQGYQLLSKLSATPLDAVISSGGGSRNQIWQTIRQQCLDVPVTTAEHTEAAYGAALIARDGLDFY